MKITFIVLSVVAVLFTSCGNTPNNEDKSIATSEELADAKIVKPSFVNTGAKLTIQVQRIYKTYLNIQTALASDKSTEAAMQAVIVDQLINGFDTTNLPADQKEAYEVHASKIRELAINMSNTRDINVQRTTFSPLSDHVYELVKTFGNDRPVYQTHCAMAFDGKGASWLSDKTEIRNPYYGSEMLECGEVINIVKK
jgi:hypothetical protein